jgi:hypothetical protein
LRDEIVELVGTWAYDRFAEHVSVRTNGRPPGARYLPHPALRRR